MFLIASAHVQGTALGIPRDPKMRWFCSQDACSLVMELGYAYTCLYCKVKCGGTIKNILIEGCGSLRVRGEDEGGLHGQGRRLNWTLKDG